MNLPVLFQRAQEGEGEMLSAIAFAAKQHWGYPREWMEEWREELTVTPDFIRTQSVCVAQYAGDVVGFFALKRQEDALHLEHLWLKPAYIGRGLGRALFAEAVVQARAAGVKELRIKSDQNAEPFYLEMGAVRTGVEEYLLLGKIRREVPLLVFYIRLRAEISQVRRRSLGDFSQ